MKRITVVHFTSVHAPFDFRVFHKELKSLGRAGYQVTLVVPHVQDQAVEGVRIRAVAVPRGRLSRMFCTVWRVYREAVRENADLYHFHDPELIPAGLLLRATGRKVIYDIHEDLPKDVLSKYYLPSWVRRPLARTVRWVETIACPHFSALVVAAAPLCERFVALNRNLVVIQNFPLREEMVPRREISWDDRPFSVGYAGLISRIRGIREMVQAMALLPRQLGATLRLAGEFELPTLKREVAALPGWTRVVSLGPVDRPRVAEVLSHVRAGLVLYHPEPNHIRAMPAKLFEYMAAGIPVIASDFPLWRQIIQSAGCGILVDPLDPRAIANAIEFVLTHPEQAIAMGHRGREAVERHYNWETEEKKLLKLYANLLQTEANLLEIPSPHQAVRAGSTLETRP